MPATPTIQELADGRMLKEPRDKNKRDGSVEPGYTLNSRYILIHLLFNVLGEAVPRNLKRGMLPSTDAASLEKMTNPFAAKLTRWRSDTKVIGSLKNALVWIKKDTLFAGGDGSGSRAVFKFNTVGHDNVERIFTQAKRSIPLNLDKGGRKAFGVPATTVSLDDVAAQDETNLHLLYLLQDAPVEETEELDLGADLAEVDA